MNEIALSGLLAHRSPRDFTRTRTPLADGPLPVYRAQMDDMNELWEWITGRREFPVPVASGPWLSIENLPADEQRRLVAALQQLELLDPISGAIPTRLRLKRAPNAYDEDLLRIFGFRAAPGSASSPNLAPASTAPPLSPPQPAPSSDTGPIIDAEWRPSAAPDPVKTQILVEPEPAAPSPPIAAHVTRRDGPQAAAPRQDPPASPNQIPAWWPALAIGAFAGTCGALIIALRTEKRSQSLESQMSSVQRMLNHYPADDGEVAHAIDREFEELRARGILGLRR